jgi:outer membrane protein OmpA-like peptidoglycan-associated protein
LQPRPGGIRPTVGFAFWGALAALGALWGPGPTGAPVARANDVELRVDARANPGQQPQLTLILKRDVVTATLDVSAREDKGARIRQTLGPGKAEGTLVFTLPHKNPGKLSWSGRLEVDFGGGAGGAMPLSFQTERLSSFKFFVDPEAVDLEQDTLTFKSERPTAKVEVEVYTDADELLASSATPHDPPIPAGQPVKVTWVPRRDADELRIRIIAFDDKGTFQSSDLFPFNISIPHEDVVFATGKAIIEPGEEAKLRPAVAEIDKALARYGQAMKAQGSTVKLFVHGHTDTVGPAESNRALSFARAQAIGRWFRSNGVKIPIWVRGFGEDRLKVQTPDATDEQQNRRAEYDVGVNGPTGSTSGWTAIP